MLQFPDRPADCFFGGPGAQNDVSLSLINVLLGERSRSMDSNDTISLADFCSMKATAER